MQPEWIFRLNFTIKNPFIKERRIKRRCSRKINGSNCGLNLTECKNGTCHDIEIRYMYNWNVIISSLVLLVVLGSIILYTI